MLRKIVLACFLGLAAFKAAGQDCFLPSAIYARTDCPERTVLYPEGFMARRGVFLTLFDGSREVALSASRDYVKLTDASGFIYEIEVPVVMTDPSSLPAGVGARVLCFGESTTEIRCKDPWNPASKGKNWVMLAREDLPSGVTLFGNIGHGGWATYTYLNWPCAAKLDPNTPDSFFKPETMWYALGLRTVTGKEFDGSVDQLSLIALTPFGKNPMDGSKALWEHVQRLSKRREYPEFNCEDEYNGSELQIDRLRDWAEELMDNPINEFYDKKTAREGDHAFSLKAYLKRSGEKAPTHVIINIGINDGDGANSLESSRECFEKLVRCFGDIPVAHFVNRWPGVIDKAMWEGYNPRQYDINGNTYNLLRLQKEWRRVDAEYENVYELDVWHCQFPASQLEEKLGNDGVLECSKNDVHTGYMGEVSSAWQVVCWLYHVLSERKQ